MKGRLTRAPFFIYIVDVILLFLLAEALEAAEAIFTLPSHHERLHIDTLVRRWQLLHRQYQKP